MGVSRIRIATSFLETVIFGAAEKPVRIRSIAEGLEDDFVFEIEGDAVPDVKEVGAVITKERERLVFRIV
jgi:hypothetical protein